MKYLYIVLGIAAISILSQGCNNDTDIKTFFIGTYTQKEGHVDGKAKGLYKITVDFDQKKMTNKEVLTGLINPSYIAIDSSMDVLIVANEVGRDLPSGFLSLVDTRSLKVLDTITTNGLAPCHINVYKSGHALFVNYMGGVGQINYNRDGFKDMKFMDLPDTTLSTHLRQEASHPHCSVTTPDGSHHYIADLGTDKIWILEANSWSDTASTLPYFRTPMASGPRHIDISNDGKKLYVINELNNTVGVLKIDEHSGSLSQMGSWQPTCEPAFVSTSNSADIRLHPTNGRVYTSNRGQNIIGTFLSNDNGINIEGYESTKGKTPRHIRLTKDGTYLLAANQDSDLITVFNVGDNGKPHYAFEINVLTPVCIVEQ